MRTVDAYSSLPHYSAHLQPIWEALPVAARGHWYGAGRRNTRERPPARWGRDRLTMVASYADMVRVGPRPVVCVEHGAGQAYQGCAQAARNGSYSGGDGWQRARLFIGPSEAVSDRWRARYDAPAVAVGCPFLDRWTAKPRPARDGPPTVAVTFHWQLNLCPETRSAWPHYDRGLPHLAAVAHERGWRLIGHGHPRLWGAIERRWRALDVERVPDWPDVLDIADVLVADNTSAMWEAAAVGVPLVVLDAPWYRRNVEHGLRFWEHADAGVRVDGPDSLPDAITLALADPPPVAGRRAAAVGAVYAASDGNAAARAAQAVLALLE